MSRKQTYTMSRAARAQRSAAALARWGSSEPKQFATVKIDRAIRDDAAALCREGESLAALVGEATRREVARRRG